MLNIPFVKKHNLCFITDRLFDYNRNKIEMIHFKVVRELLKFDQYIIYYDISFIQDYIVELN